MEKTKKVEVGSAGYLIGIGAMLCGTVMFLLNGVLKEPEFAVRLGCANVHVQVLMVVGGLLLLLGVSIFVSWSIAISKETRAIQEEIYRLELGMRIADLSGANSAPTILNAAHVAEIASLQEELRVANQELLAMKELESNQQWIQTQKKVLDAQIEAETATAESKFQ